MSKAKLILGGMKSFLPKRRSYSMAAYPVDVKYGYSVWLRHLIALERNGLGTRYRSVVELGPGNSLATGISAILTGADTYKGLDVLRHASFANGEEVLDELISLYRSRAPVPNEARHAKLRPLLQDYSFPAGIAEHLRVDDGAVSLLRHDIAALESGAHEGKALSYLVPWTEKSIAPNSVDLIVSQAVLQEMPHRQNRSDLRSAINAMASWLRPGGVASHQIDLGMYGLDPWNIHWTWADLVWGVIRGRRDNFVNREPMSTYLALFEEAGLSIVAAEAELEKGVDAESLNPRFRDLDVRDHEARSVLLIVQKK
jgi:hypothetical protein